MGTLADVVDVVIGVDTHKDTHSAAVMNAVGGTVETHQIPARRAGYAALLMVAHDWERRAWAIGGTASYGAGLARFFVHPVSESSSWITRNDRQLAMVPRPSRSTRSAKHLAVSSSANLAPARTEKRYVCSMSPGTQRFTHERKA